MLMPTLLLKLHIYATWSLFPYLLKFNYLSARLILIARGTSTLKAIVFG